MKSRNKWIVALGCLMGSVSPALSAKSLGEQLQSAMISNAASQIEMCFSDQTEISVMGVSVVCSSAQVVDVLSQFLGENPIKNCVIMHSGKKSNAGFYIMTAVSVSQKRFRIYALERAEGDNNLIRQFRIDEVIE
ncbi:MAG: DUF4783 domain-containing protein [Paludibacteraceae bacterium]|jgi:hypothetical protein|nr:DUF4783 domain-containing protein [Paludibacteraceae bacterium]MEE1175209.1 DUF4783 domain-containing protein [Paludibacteraceae bacterium]